MPHFPDPERFLSEAFRVLRRAGRVAFTVWDVPQEAKGLGAVYGAIQRHGSLNVGVPAGPNFFLFSDPKQCEQSLAGAGFEAISISKVPQIWELPDADDLFEAVLNATVRAAATLKAQRPEALKAIRESVRQAVAEYARGGVHRIPMPAVLATAVKPRSALSHRVRADRWLAFARPGRSTRTLESKRGRHLGDYRRRSLVSGRQRDCRRELSPPWVAVVVRIPAF